MLQLWLTLRLYSKTRRIPPYLVVMSVLTSYRIHSIYTLRLFNDPVAMVFLYAALNLFMDRKWTLGSILFSLGVGVKMNVLLFAPAILMLYITSLGYIKTIVQLAICATVQLIIGAPFLLTHPISYVKGSFDLGRKFEHKWTVNYRFLHIAIFDNSVFHISLLVVHLALLAIVAKPCYIFFKNYARLRSLQSHFEPQIAAENREIEETVRKKMKLGAKAQKPQVAAENEVLTEEQEKFLKSFEKGLKTQLGDSKPAPPPAPEKDPQKVEIHFDQCVQLAILPIFLMNFIGVICARSLHYQFYVWYFHSLPYLSWFTDYHTSFKILILFLIEFCWNQYPSTIFSSVLLHTCHIFLLVGVIKKLLRETSLARQAMNQKVEWLRIIKFLYELLRNKVEMLLFEFMIRDVSMNVCCSRGFSINLTKHKSRWLKTFEWVCVNLCFSMLWWISGELIENWWFRTENNWTLKRYWNIKII